MKVVIIGSGNVAWVLGRKMISAGVKVIEVFSRNIAEGERLANLLNASFVNDLLNITTEANFYIIAVKDSAIAFVANNLPKNDGIVLHTSAAQSITTLLKHERHGVIYPLQSLSKQHNQLPVVPVLVAGSSKNVLINIFEFSQQWADMVRFASDDQRLKIHVAAVFVNNFTNHLYALANEYMIHEGLPFDMLYPLIMETAGRVESAFPAKLQTGPASRNDVDTINNHLQLLQDYPDHKNLYEVLTNSIIKSQISF